MVGQPCILKYEMFFSLGFDFKEKKIMWQHGISVHPTVHFLTDSRGAILDETPKVDSFAAFDLQSIRSVQPWNPRFNKEIVIEKRKKVPCWHSSSSYCAFLDDFFNIKST